MTTSRKLAEALGRKHDSVLETIKNNLSQRAFKYGNFTRREYCSGQHGHGYEFLITRKGLEALAAVMRYNARERIAEVYAGAWTAAQKRLPEHEQEEVHTLALPAGPTTVEAQHAADIEKEDEIIQELSQWVDELRKKLVKARQTMRLYADMYENEKRRRERNGDMSGYWHDLYADLLWRVTKENNDLSKALEEHRAFRDRLPKR